MGPYDILKPGGVSDDLVNVVGYLLSNTQIHGRKIKKNLRENFRRKVEEENHDVVVVVEQCHS